MLIFLVVAAFKAQRAAFDACRTDRGVQTSGKPNALSSVLYSRRVARLQDQVSSKCWFATSDPWDRLIEGLLHDQ